MQCLRSIRQKEGSHAQERKTHIMTQPIIIPGRQARTEGQRPLTATGQSFVISEWSGSGPDYLHVHHSDDEAWHILEGTLTFRFRDRTIEAPAGTTVFVPAGVAHTYYEAAGPTRYLIIMTPRLRELIAALHGIPRQEHNAILRTFASEMVE
jgi:mannose-6-phosphate isomerase-like protein (cupin superfamily)